jgi:adenosylmethionine-8-amino-7-oxononanoate aminotransferase
MAARRIHLIAQEMGLMIYPGADGIAADQILISPPLIVTRGDIDEIVDRFEGAVVQFARHLALGYRPQRPQ